MAIYKIHVRCHAIKRSIQTDLFMTSWLYKVDIRHNGLFKPVSIKKKQKVVVRQSGTERSLPFVINSAFYYVGHIIFSRSDQNPGSHHVQTQPILKKVHIVEPINLKQ